MNIVLVRIDDRLIHGQVVMGWIPQFNIQTTFDRDDFTRLLTDHFHVPVERVTAFFERGIIEPNQTGLVLAAFV